MFGERDEDIDGWIDDYWDEDDSDDDDDEYFEGVWD